MQRALGTLKDKKDKRDFRVGGIQAPVELPRSFRLEDPFPIKDQNGFPSCTAQSTSYHKAIQEKVEMSARFLYAMIKKIEGNTSWGAYTRNAFIALTSIGCAEETVYPERHNITELQYINWKNIPKAAKANAELHKSLTYWRVESDFEAIKQAIYQNREAVVISVPWYDTYNYVDKNTGIMKREGGKYQWGHAVCIIGWKDNSLILKNSFGEDWGLKGICYFDRNFPIWDAWISLDMPKDMQVKNRYGRESQVYKEIITGYNPWLLSQIKRLPSQIEVNALWYGKWDYEAVFKGRVGDVWLYLTKAEYDNVINKHNI